MDNARELTVFVLVVASARWRLAVERDAERLERTAVEPEGVPVARIHNAGTIGEGRIERSFGRMLGRVPAVVAPALRHNPSVVGQTLGKLERVLHQRRLGRAHIHEHVRRGADRGMEEVQMRVMETGADKLVAIVDNRRGSRCDGDHIVGLADRDNTIARDGNCQLTGIIDAVLCGKDK